MAESSKLARIYVARTREYEILALKFVEVAESAEIAELSKVGHVYQ